MSARIPGLVLITGASGFIGSHLVERMVAEGVALRCLQHSHQIVGLPETVDVCRADLRDTAEMNYAMRDISVVCHLGGIASAETSHEAPLDAFRVNAWGTQNILEAARVHGVKRVIMLSTAHVFGPAQYLPVTEEHPVAPISIYGATKLCGDVLALAYHRNLDLSVTILRPFNVYGPRQTVSAIVPTIITQALADGTVRVRDTNPKRDFLFVDDVVDAIVRAAVAPEAIGKAVLLSSGRPTSIGEIIRLVTAITSSTGPETLKETEVPGTDCLFGNPALALTSLGWRPTIDIETGLARTLAWWLKRPLDKRSDNPA